MVAAAAVVGSAALAPVSPHAAYGAGSQVTPTPGAVSVLDPQYGLTGDPSADPDDTAAFTAALNDALASSVRYADGPSGPQAVLYVPPGTYRLNGLLMPSNVRMEVDAAAVFEPIAKPSVLRATDPIQLIQLGTHDRTRQVTNVSIVGTGSATNEQKTRAEPVHSGWDISTDFTVDLDPTDSGSSNDYAFATLINVKDFLISNVYVVQNNTIPTCTKAAAGCPIDRGPYPEPTTARAALVFKPSNQSSLPPGPYYDPTNGTVSDLYSIRGPFGFGPTQVTAGHDLTFINLYGEGGTTLRLETDDVASKKYGAELKGVTATNIVGVNCNRAVSLSAHKQVNSNVHITDVTATSCQDGLEQSAQKATRSGAFLDSSIDQVSVTGGFSAQLPARAGWAVGTSTNAVDTDPGALSWSADVTSLRCVGPFSGRNGKVMLNGVKQVPVCSKTAGP